MSIVEQAIAKTKRVAEQPLSPGSVQDRRPPAPGASPARPTDERLRSDAAGFPSLPVDPAACGARRILVADDFDASSAKGTAVFRMLRTRLLHRIRAGHIASLGITSPGAGEGKTLTTLNLALSLARERNSDVFVLELDMRKPGVCAALGIQPPHELLQYLRGEIGPEQLFFRIGVENLFIASGVSTADESSELLANGRLPQLLNYIRTLSSNPLVLADLPPVLETDDALVAAPMLDGLLLVVAEGRTRRDGLKRTFDVLSDFKITGIVMNRSHDNIGSGYYEY